MRKAMQRVIGADGLTWLVLGSLALVFVQGCAAGSAARQQEMPSSIPPGVDDAIDNTRVKIDPLITRIQTLRAQLDGQPSTSPEGPATGEGATEESRELAGCASTCEIADAICVSSDKICAIAAESAGNLELGERCSWATAQCTFGKQQCTGCN